METSFVKPKKSPLQMTHKHYMRGARAKKPNTRVQGQDKFFSGGPAGAQNTWVGFFCCLMDSPCLAALGQIRINDKPSRGGKREARTDAVGLPRLSLHNPETKQIGQTKEGEMVKVWRVVTSKIWP